MSDRTNRTRAGALALGVALLTGGCASAGFGEEVRADVRARMASAADPLSRCYEQALGRNRHLQGTMVLSIVAAKETGQFGEVTVSRSELPDPELERCVVAEVSALKLSRPTTARVSFEYPLQFAYTD